MANRTPLIVIGALVIGAGVWGGKQYFYAKTHVVTDNAQVDGRLLPVASRLQAYVQKVMVEDNQIVKAGDTLLVLDARDLDARVEAAKADLDVALAMTGDKEHTGQLVAQLSASQATAASASAAVASSTAAVGTAEARLRQATADLARMKGLAAKQIVPAQQLDASQAAFDAAKAALDAANAGVEAARRQQAATEAQIGVANAAIKGADARVAAARAALETAQLQRGWTVITAPMAGIISRRVVEPGGMIQAGQTTMMLVPLEEIWITANVKETHLSRIVVGDSVDFTVDGYGAHAFRGNVVSISPATGAKFALLPPDNATGNFTKVVQNVPVRIAVTGPPDTAFPLRPGMSVEVTIFVKK